MSLQLIPNEKKRRKKFTPQQKLPVLKEREGTGNGIEVVNFWPDSSWFSNLEAFNPLIVLFVIGGDSLKLFSSDLSWGALIKIIRVHGGQNSKFHGLKRESNQRRNCMQLQPHDLYEFFCFFELRIARDEGCGFP